MKIKYYLRGLGTGIIFTAIVLMIIYSYRTTDSKTIERARELGMVMPGETSKQTLKDDDKEESEKTEDNSSDNVIDEETKNDETKNEETKNEETKNEEIKDNTQESTSENNNDEETSAAEPTTEEPTTGKEVIFTISKGMYSEIVSQKLYELGVVDDAAGFNNYLVQNGFAASLRAGTYTLSTDMSYEDIAAIISR